MISPQNTFESQWGLHPQESQAVVIWETGLKWGMCTHSGYASGPSTGAAHLNTKSSCLCKNNDKDNNDNNNNNNNNNNNFVSYGSQNYVSLSTTKNLIEM